MLNKFTDNRFTFKNMTLGISLMLLTFAHAPFLVLAQTEKVEIPSDSSSFNRGNDPSVYTDNSVLNDGKWIKLGITETGIYKLTYSDLQEYGLQPSAIDPRNLAIFGNGGSMLPELNSAFRYDDLFENAVLVVGEEDGVFNENDVLLFYALNTVSWKWQNNRFIHEINYYSDTNFYFLAVKNDVGKRIQQQTQPSAEPLRETEYFLDYQHHENDLENLILSGKEWFGEEMSKSHPELQFSFQFPNRVTNRPVRFEIDIAGRSITETFNFSVSSNGQTIVNPLPFQQLSIGNSTHAREVYQNLTFNSEADDFSFTITIDAENDNSEAWLNFIRINTWRKLIYEGTQLQFSNPDLTMENGIGRYKLSGIPEQVYLWDITEPLLPKSQEYMLDSNQLEFKAFSDTLRHFIAFEASNAFSVTNFKAISNQNLHAITSCDMLIVAHPDFIAQAEELAGVHYTDDGLQSIVVNINDIYNEFGSGKADISAIRDFVRMVYLKSNQQLKYLLLFGDGSYDYKNRIPNNTNFISTYEASGSLVETQSFVSDDYFGLLDQNEGLEMFGILDIGIGRFPVSTKEDAQVMVEKVKSYLLAGAEQNGEWRNNITFMADDADSNLHFNQAETLSQDVDTAFANLNIRKIYLDSYKRAVVPGGYRYPDANNSILSQIEEGSLIVNYTGHGGITGLSDEKVFTIGEIENLSNHNKLPFFITATCEFSRFDNPGFVSAGERLLLNPTGGAIALMTTTRLAFAHSNFAVNRRVYDAMFENNRQQIRRLGDIIRMSKNPTSTYIYNFVLLGDPALRLAYPKYKVEVTEFNGTSPSLTDTLGAMSEVVLKGQIFDQNEQLVSDFNGYLYPKMFDKKSKFKTLANDGASLAAFFSYFEKLIYKGKVSVKEGQFELRYMIPKDIAYQFGQAKLSFYAVDTTNYSDAGGYFNELVVGGFDETVNQDQNGPEIEMYINEPSFKNGDYSSPNPVVYIQLNDPQGIHFLGNSIGRDIVLTYEGAERKQYQLNHYFETSLDAFDRGTIMFNLHDLPAGSHRLSLKAWDLHNNSSEFEIWFKVDQTASIAISELSNRPNPFSSTTEFVFQHNKPDQPLKVTIDIFNQMGSRVTQFTRETQSSGIQSSPIKWDGTRSDGSKLPAGLYVYNVQIEDEGGNVFNASQRLIILPLKE